jgi:hypothetical protein
MDGGFTECPEQGCGWFVEAMDTRLIVCNKCNFRFCAACKREYHYSGSYFFSLHFCYPVDVYVYIYIFRIYNICIYMRVCVCVCVCVRVYILYVYIIFLIYIPRFLELLVYYIYVGVSCSATTQARV